MKASNSSMLGGNKSSYVLEQTCNYEMRVCMQVCLSTYDLLSTSVINVLTRKKILTTDSEN